jgi:hypothetical protein
VVVVAAAGNLGQNHNGRTQYGAICAPGNAPWVLTVGASSTNGTLTRVDDSMARFSSRGPTYLDYLAKPDLVAPGVGTVSTTDAASFLYLTKPLLRVAGLLPLGSKPYLSLSGTSMAAPVVTGSVALMLQANPSLTPNAVKAILQYTAQLYPRYDFLTQGAGFLNTEGAVKLAAFLKTAKPGDRYPTSLAWAKHILWGNHRLKGGYILMNGANAWGTNVVWGNAQTDQGDNIVWGNVCGGGNCTDVVWGALAGDDNIVWGNTVDGDNIVWGNLIFDDNIVWGNACGGGDCDNIVWGNASLDNIVWGNAAGDDNIVWGNSVDPGFAWGTSDDDDTTWGSSTEDETAYPDALAPAEENLTFDDLFYAPPPPPPASTPLPSVGGLLPGLGGL